MLAYDAPTLVTVGGVARVEGNSPSKGVAELGCWFLDSENNIDQLGPVVAIRAWSRREPILAEGPKADACAQCVKGRSTGYGAPVADFGGPPVSGRST